MMTSRSRQEDLFQGRQSRDLALDSVEFSAETREDWVAKARAAAVYICEKHGTKWYIVEHERGGPDPVGDVGRCLQALKKMGK